MIQESELRIIDFNRIEPIEHNRTRLRPDSALWTAYETGRHAGEELTRTALIAQSLSQALREHRESAM